MIQNDVKYLFAWSTIGQNAYSLLGIGTLTAFGVSGGVYYFLSHIIGKCILFSVAGIVLAETGRRDIRKMGGLASKMPITATLAIIGALILSAVPPLSGFQAEWLMFAGIFSLGVNGAQVNLAVAFLGIIATLLTVGYTLWPLRRIFFGKLPEGLQSVHEAPWVMIAPLLALAVISLLIGVYPELMTKLLYGYAHSLPIPGGR
jgi:NADH-quinone oxidoreductase subunit M